MPDPAKSIGDIDDVLSSIRRLVAEQPSANRVDAHRADAGSSQPDDNGRLVLTPALRVTDPHTSADTPASPREPATADLAAESAEAVPQSDARHDDVPVDIDLDLSNGSEVTSDPQDPALEGPVGVDKDPQDTLVAGLAVPSDIFAFAYDTPAPEAPMAVDPTMMTNDTAPVTPDDTPMTPEPKISEAYAEGASEDAHRDSPDTMQSGDATDIAALDAAPDTVSAPEMDEDPTEQPVAEAWTSDAADGAGDMQPGSGEGTDHPDTDAADSHQDARIVGDAGWRPEMRLFDWEAAVAADDAANAERAGATSEFEPDTGDADWPGEGADRAVLDLAAARETGVPTCPPTPMAAPTMGPTRRLHLRHRGHRLHADLLSAPRSSIGPCLGHDRYHRRADRGGRRKHRCARGDGGRGGATGGARNPRGLAGPARRRRDLRPRRRPSRARHGKRGILPRSGHVDRCRGRDHRNALRRRRAGGTRHVARRFGCRAERAGRFRRACGDGRTGDGRTGVGRTGCRADGVPQVTAHGAGRTRAKTPPRTHRPRSKSPRPRMMIGRA
jgi:hypothetical protein